jgi:hypothetical protein
MGRKKGRVTEILLERIGAGEQKSCGDWAEELFGEITIATKGRISGALSTLRKNGHMFFPVELGGPVKDVTDNATEFNHCVNRYVTNNVEPQLVRSFNYAEKLVLEHPKLKDEVLMRAKQLIQLAGDSNKALLGVTYDRPRTKRRDK